MKRKPKKIRLQRRNKNVRKDFSEFVRRYHGPMPWYQSEIMRIVQDCSANGKKLMVFVPSRGKS